MNEQNGMMRSEEPIRVLIRDLTDKFDKSTQAQLEHIKRVDRLFTVVLGDEEANIDGLVDKVQRHGKYISLDKKLKIAATSLAASTTGGWLGWDIIKAFFK